jgi:tol-pal system protein YbgF
VVLLATGCASRSSLDRIRADVANMRFEVSDLRQAQQTTSSDLTRVMADSRPMAARTREAAALVEETAAEVARLRARIEALESEARDAKAKAAASPLVAPPPPAPAPSSAPAAARAPVPPPAPPPGPGRSARALPQAERPRKPAARAASPEQAYAAALATFRAREHGQAVLDFLDFIAKHPDHRLVANAQYWIGEAYYAQRDFRQALTEFSKVPHIAPGSAKAGDALLKIGLCQRHLRDEARARLTWQRVVRDFPRSEAAAKAHGFLGSRSGTAQR